MMSGRFQLSRFGVMKSETMIIDRTKKTERRIWNGFSVLKICVSHILLILLVACVCLLATSIALGVQLMQVSQKMSEGHEILNRKLKNSEKERDQLNSDLAKLAKEFDDCSLIECCPRRWKLIYGKCIHFSTWRDVWAMNDTCKDENSLLLTFSKQDSQIQEYIKQNCNTHWAFIWPDYLCVWRDGSLRIYYLINKNGEIHEQSNVGFLYRWICEKDTDKLTFQGNFSSEALRNKDCIWRK
ncbi:uncharacterized protein LOC115461771 [Microcaecilia unicolor]|uniref:Uncharacterized protein LOC115461771 n=1 Tax=Microcaecilia unicolor TaxID=1415580 RepID=A0A6P7X2R6_9AMPH|nr:uncharacterized protein LOC115461771 [Microcaecilia unicolor]